MSITKGTGPWWGSADGAEVVWEWRGEFLDDDWFLALATMHAEGYVVHPPALPQAQAHRTESVRSAGTTGDQPSHGTPTPLVDTRTIVGPALHALQPLHSRSLRSPPSTHLTILRVSPGLPSRGGLTGLAGERVHTPSRVPHPATSYDREAGSSSSGFGLLAGGRRSRRCGRCARRCWSWCTSRSSSRRRWTPSRRRWPLYHPRQAG